MHFEIPNFHPPPLKSNIHLKVLRLLNDAIWGDKAEIISVQRFSFVKTKKSYTTESELLNSQSTKN